MVVFGSAAWRAPVLSPKWPLGRGQWLLGFKKPYTTYLQWHSCEASFSCVQVVLFRFLVFCNNSRVI